MKRIIVANPNYYHRFSLEEATASVQKTGFRYIELTATKGQTEHVFPSMSSSRLCRARDELQKVGLAPISMSGHCSLMDPQWLFDFMDNIRLIASFGREYIVSSVGEAYLKDSTAASNQELVRDICSLLSLLKRYVMKPVLEVRGEHGNGKIAREATDAVAPPLVSVNYSTVNAALCGEVSPVQSLDDYISSIGYTHVKDGAGGHTEWNFSALKEGAVDLPTIFEKLSRASSNCPLSVEVKSIQDDPKDSAAVDEVM